MTGQDPDEGVTSAADLSQKSSFGLSRSIRSLFFGLLHEGFVRKDGLELIATDGDDEESEEDTLEDE